MNSSHRYARAQPGPVANPSTGWTRILLALAATAALASLPSLIPRVAPTETLPPSPVQARLP